MKSNYDALSNYLEQFLGFSVRHYKDNSLNFNQMLIAFRVSVSHVEIHLEDNKRFISHFVVYSPDKSIVVSGYYVKAKIEKGLPDEK